MTAPNASRHSVAVMSTRCSIGLGGAARAVFFFPVRAGGRGSRGRRAAVLTPRAPGSALPGPRSRGTGRRRRRPARAGRRLRARAAPRAPRTACSRSPQKCSGTSARREGRGEHRRVLTDEVDRAAVLVDGLPRGLKSWPLPRPPAMRWTGPSKEAGRRACWPRSSPSSRCRRARRRGWPRARGDGPRRANSSSASATASAWDAQGQGRRRGGHGVLAVVPAGEADAVDGEQRLAAPPEHPVVVAQVGLRARRRSAPWPPWPPRRGRRATTATSSGRLVGEDAQLGRHVGLVGPVAVDVVGGEVEQHRALGREGLGVLELEGRALAGDPGVGFEAAGHGGQRRPDVPGHRHRPAGGAVDGADELGRRRLAVRARHGDEAVGHEPPGELDLPEHREPRGASGPDHRGVLGHAGALDQRAGTGNEVLTRDIEVHFDARPGKPAHVRVAGVQGDDLLASGGQRQRRGHARAGQPDDEIRASGERWARAHGPRSADPGGRPGSASGHGLLVDGEADGRQHRGHDPEAQDDLRLRPGHAARSGGGSGP